MAAGPEAHLARLERLSGGLLVVLPLAVAWLSVLDGPGESHPWLVVAVASAQSFALSWCRRFPLAVLAVELALESPLVAVDAEIFVGFLAGAFALGTWGKPLQQRVGLVGGLSVLGLAVAYSIAAGAPSAFALAGVGSMAVMFVGFWLSGRLGARQRTRIHEFEAERAEAEQRAAERERALLARELHDILNHSVTTMVLDATAAAETGSPDEARETLTRVAQTGRNSLAELRRLLGVLRANASAADHDPLAVPPGLAQVDSLVAATPGPRITLVRSGTAGPLDVSIEHAAYRVIQESLTNVVKHAGPVETTVSLSFTPDHLSVVVTNGGPVVAPNPGSGMGLIGMRERVSLVGGALVAGPRPDGGFEVRAVLPVRTAACSA